MKEQEPVYNQNKLTNQPNSLNLEGIGNIMADGTNGTPEEQQPKQDEAKSGAENRSGQENTNRANSRMKEEEARRSEEIMVRFNGLHPLEQAKIDKTMTDVFGDLNSNPDLKILARGSVLDAAAQSRVREERRGNQIGVPESLEDLAQLIIKTSDPAIWGENGEHPLINKEGRVDSVNFLAWARGNMIKVHNFNPTSRVDFFNDLGMSVRNDVYGSMISFYEIVFQENLFLDTKKDENGNEVKVANADYKLLRDQLLTEVFLFSLMRNGDIAYTTQRGQQKEMLEALTQAFIVNPLTRSNFFEFIFTMPSMQRESIRDIEAGEDETIKAKREGNFYMGDAVRQALSAYMNIFDYGQLKTILGKDAALFKRDYAEMDADTGAQKIKEGKAVTLEVAPDVNKPDKRKKEWFKEDGSLRLYEVEKSGRNIGKYKKDKDGDYVEDASGLPHPEYMDYINIFLSPNPDQRQQTEARERIALSIMEKNDISYSEAKLAEAWAFSMTHINGISARNDTQSVAFDWWTRLTNFKDYRKRQKAEKRGAAYGGNYNMEGFKRIGLNFFEASRDIRERTIQEIIQGGQGEKIDIQANPLKNKVDFEKDESGMIVFYDQNDQKVHGLSAKRGDIIRELDQTSGKYKSRVKYFDESNREVNIGGARSKTVITQVEKPVQFKADLQKQFLPNHMITAAGVYEHIITQAQMNFPEMLKGYDTHGNPILDQEKIEKIKKGIEHCIRYSLSTWPEINYEDKYVMWERKEVRSENSGRLIAKKRGVSGEVRELDEDWYVLKNGHKTQERNEPETYLHSKEMTIMESMFGVDALKFIQFEIEKRKLTYNDYTEEEKKKHQPVEEPIRGIGFDGKEHEVIVDLSHAKEEEFKIAVWRGAFDYLIATEIAAHRDRNSGFEWYNGEKMIKVIDVLKEGEFVTPDQIGNIQKETGTKLKWLFTQDLGYIFLTGGLEGFWKVFQIMFKDVMGDVSK